MLRDKQSEVIGPTWAQSETQNNWRDVDQAQHIGSIDGATPQRAHQDIAPSVARLVWRRDHGRCRVPGCRSARGIEIHHIVHRADGGKHDASNLCLLCSSCHIAHHDRRITIRGTADQLEVRRAHVGPTTKLDNAIICTHAKDALVTLGWKPPIARAAVDAAYAELGRS